MILKSQVSKNSFVDHLIFTSDARTGWDLILKSGKKKKQKILLPSYIGYSKNEGSGIFDPVISNNIGYKFYSLDSKLSFDLNSIEQEFKSGDIFLMLQVHYFGFCQQSVEDVKELCSKYNVILVEDCAHAFHYGMPEYKLGTKGDYSFFSIHKYLPTKNGGLLQLNSDLLHINKKNNCPLNVLEQLIKTNLEEVADKRINNYKFLEKLLKGVKLVEILFPYKDGIIPHSFPVLIKNNLRESLYFYLLEKKMPITALYYSLITPLSKTKFPITNQLSNDILNLPIHQDTEFKDLEELVNEIKVFFKNK